MIGRFEAAAKRTYVFRKHDGTSLIYQNVVSVEPVHDTSTMSNNKVQLKTDSGRTIIIKLDPISEVEYYDSK